MAIRGAGTDSGYGPSVAASAYVKQLFAKKVLRNFYEITVFGTIANTDYQGEIKGMGDKVWLRTTPELTISDYQVGEDISAKYEVPASNARELDIDQGKMWAFQIDDIDDVQTDLNLMNIFANDAAERMAIAIDRDVLRFIAVGTDATSDAWSTTSDVATTNWGPTAGAISGDINLGDSTTGTPVPRALNSTDNDVNNILSAIVDCSQVLDEANIGQEGRWIVLPAWACALLKKGDLRRADITGDGTGVIRNGVIGMVDNFTIYRSNNVFEDETNGGNFYIPFGTNEAVTFASQLVKTESLRIQNSFGEYMRGLNVYGRAIPQPTAIGLLYATKA